MLPTAGNKAAKTAGRVELPIAGNRAAKTAGRVDSRVLYYPIFTTFACHTMSENILYYTNIVKNVIATTSTACILGNTNCLADLNAEVASWNIKRKANNSSSSSIHDENVGEDGLSSLSTYNVSINSLYHVESIQPNPKLFEELITDEDILKDIYTSLSRAVNELKAQHSMNKTLFVCDKNGQTSNTHIAEVLAKKVTLNINDPELSQWSHANQFARIWHCKDLHNSPILKQAIQKAIDKTEYHNKERGFFHDESHDDGQVDQFVGFMSLHRTVIIVTCFHIHSFVVFHTLKDDTIVTCMLPARDCILSNMQDRVLQIMQLIQFCHAFKFLVTIMNNFIGNDVDITKWSLAGYEAMGFDVTPLTQNTNQDLFSFGTEHPIPVAFYFDHYTWAKYGKFILPSKISLEESEKNTLHATFWKSFQQFL